MTNAIDWEIAANRHRPDSLEEIALAVRTLRDQGLRPRDIAVALRLNDADVENILAGRAP